METPTAPFLAPSKALDRWFRLAVLEPFTNGIFPLSKRAGCRLLYKCIYIYTYIICMQITDPQPNGSKNKPIKHPKDHTIRYTDPLAAPSHPRPSHIAPCVAGVALHHTPLEECCVHGTRGVDGRKPGFSTKSLYIYIYIYVFICTYIYIYIYLSIYGNIWFVYGLFMGCIWIIHG